jgi:hypothetical protein
MLRSLAKERERNREIATHGLHNVIFGIEALSSFLDGEGTMLNYAHMSTKRAVDVRRKWQKAITKVGT